MSQAGTELSLPSTVNELGFGEKPPSDGTRPGTHASLDPGSAGAPLACWGTTCSTTRTFDHPPRKKISPCVLMLHVYAAVAEEEARAISRRTKAALAAAKARGVRVARGIGDVALGIG
jgi:Resolvase, N terminal domain